MRWMLLLAVVVLWMGTPVSAQFVVHDPGNAAINSATAIQSTISAVENTIQSAYALLDITPLDDIVLAVDFLETVNVIQAIVTESVGLVGDAQTADRQVRLLFGLDNIPRTPIDLQLRVNEINGVLFEARVYATRVQSLMTTLASALGHLTRLVQQIGILTGNQGSNQVIIQQLSVANQTLVTQAAAQMAAQRTETLQQMSRQMVAESLNRMEADSWASWPRALGGQ